MIVRHIDQFAVITAQTDHAWASAEVARHLTRDYLPEELTTNTVSMIQHHDDGWIGWENDPRLTESGAPVNFTEITEEEHNDIWNQGIVRAETNFGAFASALLMLHKQAIDIEGPVDFSNIYSPVIRSVIDGTLPEKEVERAFRLLRLTDLITLIPCAGWKSPIPVQIYDPADELTTVTLSLTDTWEIELDDWPFLEEELVIRIPVVVKPGIESWEKAMNRLLSGTREYQELRVYPNQPR